MVRNPERSAATFGSGAIRAVSGTAGARGAGPWLARGGTSAEWGRGGSGKGLAGGLALPRRAVPAHDWRGVCRRGAGGTAGRLLGRLALAKAAPAAAGRSPASQPAASAPPAATGWDASARRGVVVVASAGSALPASAAAALPPSPQGLSGASAACGGAVSAALLSASGSSQGKA